MRSSGCGVIPAARSRCASSVRSSEGVGNVVWGESYSSNGFSNFASSCGAGPAGMSGSGGGEDFTITGGTVYDEG